MVSAQDAAERHRRYWTTTIKMADEIDAEAFIERVIWANDVTSYLPCLKNKVGSPALWPVMNVPFSEIGLCTHVIHALPTSLSVAYWANKGTHFPVCLKTLAEDLKYIEVQVNRNKRALEDLSRHVENVPKNGVNKGNRTYPKEDGARIPKKAARASTAAAAGGRSKKHCALCRKWSAAIAHTHNTKDCRKWNADGSQKGKQEYHGSNGNYANTASCDDDFKKAFAQQ